VNTGQLPPVKTGGPSVANLQFDMIIKHPYKYSSDDVIFQVYAQRNNIPKAELKTAREQFFAKGQACLRASPLTKRYGWGVHNDENGKIAIYARDSEAYEQFSEDDSIAKVRAMRTSK
jgi:hypothetical protein